MTYKQFNAYLDDGYAGTSSATKLDGYAAGAISFNSVPIDTGDCVGLSMTVYIPSTGSPVGTLKLQGSNTYNVFSATALPTSAIWFDISTANFCSGDSSVSVTAAGITQAYNFEKPPFRWLRLVYTRSSGSCTITVQCTRK